MTIVGIEKLRSGETSLVVFDPKYHEVKKVSRVMERGFQTAEWGGFLKLYRRDLSYLENHCEFELLE